MPLKKLWEIDVEILKLREVIAAKQASLADLKKLDELIDQRIEFINGLSQPHKGEAEKRPRPYTVRSPENKSAE